MIAINGNEILIFAPIHNTGNKKDATGAFQPEARAFARKHDVPQQNIFLIDNRRSKTEMKNVVIAAIERAKVDHGTVPKMIAFFCHGMRESVQLGFNRRNVTELALSLAGVKDVRVVLYACSTAKGENAAQDMEAVGGDGGFADRLRDLLCQAGAVDCQVDAHSTAGHTTKNPYVRRFQGMGSPFGGVGGFFIASPANRSLWKQWKKQLRESELRYDFPFMTVAEIHGTLKA
jgi:hypothetical protein